MRTGPADSTRRVQRKRLAKALLIVSLVVAVVPAGSALARSGSEDARSTNSALSVESLYDAIFANDIESIVGAAGLQRANLSEIPDDSPVAEALGNVDGVRELWIAQDVELAGAILDDEAPQTFGRVVSSLERAGWTYLQSGSAAAGSFCRDEGLVRWMFVSCVQEGQATTVVIQWLQEEEPA